MAKQHTHKFVARPCDDKGKIYADRSRDLSGKYVSYRRFVKFKFNRKGEQGQAYIIHELCQSPCTEVTIRKVMATPR